MLPWSGAGAGRLDLAAVLGDDPVADRQPQPRPLAGAAAREERLEDVLQHLRRHAAAGVREDQLGHAVALRAGVIVSVPPSSMLSRALTTRFRTTCLISWALTQASTRLARLEDELLAPAVVQVLDHVEHALDQLGQVGRLALALAAAAEVEQLLRDLLAAERLLLDHLQVLGDDLAILAALGRRAVVRAGRPAGSPAPRCRRRCWRAGC